MLVACCVFTGSYIAVAVYYPLLALRLLLDGNHLAVMYAAHGETSRGIGP